MEKQQSQFSGSLKKDTLPLDPNPIAHQSQGFLSSDKENELYPEQIPEAQGDLADQANIEIDQELQENIRRARQNVDPSRQHYKETR